MPLCCWNAEYLWYLYIIINYPSRIPVLVFLGKVHIRVSDTYHIRYPYRYPCNIGCRIRTCNQEQFAKKFVSEMLLMNWNSLHATTSIKNPIWSWLTSRVASTKPHWPRAGWGFSGWPVGPPSLMHYSDWALLPSQSTVATGEISQRRLVIKRTEQGTYRTEKYQATDKLSGTS